MTDIYSNNKNEILPWQLDAWGQMKQLAQRGVGGILLCGQHGLGASALARYFAKCLLCQRPLEGGAACGSCDACTWVDNFAHPDLLMLRPEELEIAEGASATGDESEASASADGEEAGGVRKKAAPSREIRIEQVRRIAPALALGSHRAGMRVVLVYPAEAINHPAGNALLKILEEPPAATLFVLCADQPERLMPTIVSRCQRVVLRAPSTEAALQWLRAQSVKNPEQWLSEAGGAPLAALELAYDLDELGSQRKALFDALADPARFNPLALELVLARVEPSVVVGWLLRWVYDCLAYCLAGRIRYYPQEAKRIERLAQASQVWRLLAYWTFLCAQARLVRHPLNRALFLDDLLAGYGEAMQR